MKVGRNKLVIFPVLFLIFGVGSFWVYKNRVNSPQSVSIAAVLENPRKFHDKKIVIKGKVRKSFFLFFKGIYELQDETGSITVVSSIGTPMNSNSSIIEVKGRVGSLVVLNKRKLPVIFEENLNCHNSSKRPFLPGKFLIALSLLKNIF